MTNDYRYILEPYKGMNTRYHCPSCQSREKTFTLYMDTQTNRYLSDQVGRCERVNNCGHHYTPKEYFQDHNASFNNLEIKHHNTKNLTVKSSQSLTSEIPIDIFKSSLNGSCTNHLTTFLNKRLGTEQTNKLISKYFIGTSSYWQGSTVFWQIDNKGKIRGGKIMYYDPTHGKRIKQPYNHITWIHKTESINDFKLNQGLFGLHLLKHNQKPIALCESEKTAIIASVYLSRFTWLATGSITNLNENTCKPLLGKPVVLFPDLGAYDLWWEKAKTLAHITDFKVSDLLEKKATQDDRAQGFDLTDYLLKYNWKDFKHNGKTKDTSLIFEHPKEKESTKSTKWNTTFLEGLYKDFKLPDHAILFDGKIITKPSDYVQEQMKLMHWYNGIDNEKFSVHYECLSKLIQYLHGK